MGGFIDLRQNPSAVQVLEEAAGHPAQREALVTLNSRASAVFTSKCDLWTLSNSEIDRDEFGARFEDARAGFASYIDVLQRDHDQLRSFEFHERWVRSLTEYLRSVDLCNGRVEFIIRPASIDSTPGYGVTLYAAGCGAGASAAYTSWKAVLRAAVAATMNLNPSSTRASSSIG
jgi:hypothetical protein